MSRAETALVCSSILSASVLLPWSMCAIILKFLILSRENDIEITLLHIYNGIVPQNRAEHKGVYLRV